MKGLTLRQLEILDYIEKYISVHHFPPSFRTLQKAFSFSSLGTVSNLVRSLKRKGALQQRGRLVPTKDVESLVAIPLVGKVRSGHPLSMHKETRSINLPRHMASEMSYLLEVKEEEGMLEGDWLIVEPRIAEEGDVVIALVAESHALVRKFFPGDPIILKSNTETLRLRKEHVTIVGVVTNLIRNYSG